MFAFSTSKYIEIIESDLPICDGAQLALDITMTSAFHADCSHKTAAYCEDVATTKRTRGDEERQYQELTASGRCRRGDLPVKMDVRFGPELG